MNTLMLDDLHAAGAMLASHSSYRSIVPFAAHLLAVHPALCRGCWVAAVPSAVCVLESWHMTYISARYRVACRPQEHCSAREMEKERHCT